ncbi:MAG: cytochrome P450 [Thermoleophilaceae bacterium]
MGRALPPGPRAPKIVQTVGWWSRPTAFLERCRRRYGGRFTLRLLVNSPLVMLSDPEDLRQVFTAPADVLHPGEGARILEPLVGTHSVILLDEREHLEQRKLMLPAFHGDRMQRLEALVVQVADSEVERWPRDEPVTLHPRLQGLTLEIILRAVFGLDPGERLDGLRARLTELLELSSRPMALMPAAMQAVAGRALTARFDRVQAETDALIFELIGERRLEDESRDDVLSMLLDARHEDGSPMSDQELRDELLTLLVAGHETTASALAWAFERLARLPAVLEPLRAEVDGEDGDRYLTATVQETLRRRPVLPNAAPRLVKQPVTIAGWDFSPGVCLAPSAYLVHHDPAIYPDPYAFRPERFLEQQPGTYTWIPFGGGRRRCLGASFALLEMKTVVRSVLERLDLVPGASGAEAVRRRSITISPMDGARMVLHTRERTPPLSEPEVVAR